MNSAFSGTGTRTAADMGCIGVFSSDWYRLIVVKSQMRFESRWKRILFHSRHLSFDLHLQEFHLQGPNTDMLYIFFLISWNMQIVLFSTVSFFILMKLS